MSLLHGLSAAIFDGLQTGLVLLGIVIAVVLVVLVIDAWIGGPKAGWR